MNTALRRSLPEDKWLRLKTAALDQFNQLKADNERTTLYNKLTRFEQRAEGDFSDRLLPVGAVSGNGNVIGDPKKPLRSIFLLKNKTLGIVRSVKRFLLARVVKDLFGSEPYFHVKPEGRADKQLSLRMQKHAGWKLRLAKYREKIKRAIEQVLDVGFCFVKTTWDVQTDVSERLEMILLHRATGEPVLTQDGDYIYEDDETAEVRGQRSGVSAEDEAVEMPAPQAEEGGAEMEPVSTVFVKAPEVDMSSGLYVWGEWLVEEKIRIYNGLRIDPCDRKDVFYDQSVADIADSIMVAHQFDRRLSELRRCYAKESYAKGEEGEASESMLSGDVAEKVDTEVMQILDRLKGESSTPKAEATQPRDDEGMSNAGVENDPTILTVEASFDFDCFEDGIVRRLHMVLLPDHNECIYAEYRAAIAPQAAKNIHILAINRPKNRAYGRGLDEVYEEMADSADELLNGILHRNEYNSKPKVVWNPQNTVEGKANKNLNFWDTETITPDSPQMQPKDIAYPITLPDLDERTWQLMELFMQLIQLDSGVTNASQGDVSNLPSNSTATGINSMLESSSVLHQFILEEIRDGLTTQLGFAIGLIYLRQDEDETYEYLEVQDERDPASVQVVEQMMALKDARKLRHMPMNVEIMLTRSKAAEQREAAIAGIPLGMQFSTLPPDAQFRMREAFVQLFRSLNFDNPEDFFPTPEELAQQVAGMLQQAGWIVQPPSPSPQAAIAEQGELVEGGGVADQQPPAPALPANVSPSPVA